MHQRERTGGEKAWEELFREGVALKMRSCWHGFGSGFTQRSFTQRSFTGRTLHRVFYTEKLLRRKGFTHTHIQKLLHREIFIQSSLDTDKLMTSRDLHSLEN